MSGSSNKGKDKGKFIFAINDSGWADFFITRIGLIIFAVVFLAAAFKIYPIFQEREIMLSMDAQASDISSKIEAFDSITIPEYKYNYMFKNNIDDIKIEISTEYVTARTNLNSPIWGERELFHPEPLIAHVYPPNNYWKNSSGFRKYLSDNIGNGKNGDAASPLGNDKKEIVDAMFENITKELAKNPFIPDLNKPLLIEKVIIHYRNQTEIQKRDYVFIGQR